MVPYIDSKGVLWSIDPPGTVLTRDGEDGRPEEYHSENWTARITSDAYGHPADTTLAISTDARDIRDNIETYVTSPLRAVPVKPTDGPPRSSGAGWLWLLGLLWLLDEKKKRR